MNQPTGRLRIFILTALTMVAFAANSVLNRLALLDGGIGAVDFATVRVAAGAVTLTALAALRGGQWWKAARFSSAAALATYMLGFSLAYLALGAGAGALVLFGAVQVTMFAGALRAREPVPRRRWIGTGIAMAGLLVLVGRVDLPVAEAMAFLFMAAAGVGWGVFSLLGRGASDPLGATAAAFVLALPAVALATLAVGLEPMTGRGLLLAVLSGAVTSGLGYALWYAVLPRLARTSAALAQLSVPVIAALGGVALIGEPLTGRLMLATLLVVGGVLVGTLAARRADGRLPQQDPRGRSG